MKKNIGITLIAEERQRQIDSEGYDIMQDFEFNSKGELAGAAGCYIANALNKMKKRSVHAFFEVQYFDDRHTLGRVDGWPWDHNFDKRVKHDQIRSLVIAGALIVAEIDRLKSLE